MVPAADHDHLRPLSMIFNCRSKAMPSMSEHQVEQHHVGRHTKI